MMMMECITAMQITLYSNLDIKTPPFQSSEFTVSWSIIQIFDCVFFSDPPDLLSSFVDHIRNESDTLQLHCNFTGTPSPAVWWYRNVSGQFERLRHTGRFVITETKSEEERVTDSYLEVSNLVKSDEGTYRCLGVNNVLNLINAEESDEAYITIYGKLAIEQHNYFC